MSASFTQGTLSRIVTSRLALFRSKCTSRLLCR
jgi:hypothetical protein